MRKIHELLKVALRKFDNSPDFLCYIFGRCRIKKKEYELMIKYLYENRPDKTADISQAFWYYDDAGMESRRQWLIKHIQITKEADI